jgi:hypothetical protein
MGGFCVKGEDRGGTIDDVPATKKPKAATNSLTID